MARRLSTIISDLEHAMADLEILASIEEDKDGFQPGRAQRVGTLSSAAGGVSQVLGNLRGLL
jgi:hypothetical protein